MGVAVAMKCFALLVFLPCAIFAHDINFGHSHCEFDFVLVVDSSGSIKDNGGETAWNEMLQFVRMLINDIDRVSPVGSLSRIALLSYSHQTKIDASLGDNLNKDALMGTTINYQGSITRMLWAVQNATRHLQDNTRTASTGDPVTQVVVLFTDGRPHDPQRPEETSQNVLNVLKGLMNNEVHVIMIGITSAADQDLLNAIDSYSDFGRGQQVDGFQDLTDTVAQHIIEPLQISCPNIGPTTTPSPAPTPMPGTRITDLIIVIDDTNGTNFDVSYNILQTLINGQLQPWIANGILNVLIVTSSQTVTPVAIGTLQRPQSTSYNRLYMALKRAYDEFIPMLNNGRYKMLLVIHSGDTQYDSGQNVGPFMNPVNPDPMNSMRFVVWYQLKFLINADIFTIALPRATPHGWEVLYRLNTRRGPVLTTAENIYNTIISQYYPTFDSCQNYDLTLLIDVSGSSDFTQIKRNVLRTLSYLRANQPQQTRVAIVTFADFPFIHYDLEAGQISNTGIYNAIVNLITNLQPPVFRMSNMAAGMWTVANLIYSNHGDRKNGTNHVIIFSDAQSNMQTRGDFDAVHALTALQSAVHNITLFQTSGVVSTPYAQLTFPSTMNADTIATMFRSTLSQFCQPIDITHVNPCDNLAIVFDSSGSLEDKGRQGHRHVKDFVVQLIHDYYTTFGKRAQNITVVHYSAYAATLVEFDNYANRLETTKADVQKAEHIGGRTHLEAALNLAVKNIGHPLKADTAIVFMTDGEANEGKDGGTVVSELHGLNEDLLFGIFMTDNFKDGHDDMRQVLPPERYLDVKTFQDLTNNQAQYIKWVTDRVCPS